LTHFQSIAGAGQKLVKTDIPSGMLATYVDLAIQAKSQGIKSVELVPPVVNVIHPNFDEIHNLIKQAFTAKSK
jgi:hypothetical protein